MKTVYWLLLSAGLIVGSTLPGSAQYYYGPYYAPPPPPYYGGGYYGGEYYAPRPRRYYRDPSWGANDPRINPNAGCPYGWTRQAGICKPYRGY